MRLALMTIPAGPALALSLAILGLALAPVVRAATAGRGDAIQPAAVLATPENRIASPYTGYTREHWIEITGKLIAGIMPYFNQKSGMPELKGVPSERGHFVQLFDVTGSREAFDRSLTMVAIYTVATGSDRVPGWEGSITAPYLKEIIRGTDPKSPHYWGPHPKYDVFGTNLATSILLSPQFFWEPLSPAQQENVLAYFQDLVHTFAYDCNHWYFHLAAVPVLARAGREDNRAFLSTDVRTAAGLAPRGWLVFRWRQPQFRPLQPVGLPALQQPVDPFRPPVE